MFHMPTVSATHQCWNVECIVGGRADVVVTDDVRGGCPDDFLLDGEVLALLMNPDPASLLPTRSIELHQNLSQQNTTSADHE